MQLKYISTERSENASFIYSIIEDSNSNVVKGIFCEQNVLELKTIWKKSHKMFAKWKGCSKLNLWSLNSVTLYGYTVDN